MGVGGGWWEGCARLREQLPEGREEGEIMAEVAACLFHSLATHWGPGLCWALRV